MGEFITKRIPTILIARELWLKRYSKFAFQDISRKDLARHFGYRQWYKYRETEKSEIDLRLKFLREYTRRLETTNILAIMKLKSQFLAANDEIKGRFYSSDFYQRSMDAYYRHGDARLVDMVDHTELSSTKRKLWKRLNAIK